MKAAMKALLLVVLLASSGIAQQFVDLRTWTAESYPAVSGFGAGVWTVAPDGSSVFQSVNGQPTLFVSDFDAFDSEVEGVMTVSPGAGDDDYIGFALGFHPGDTGNPGADYLLIDWKRSSQDYDFEAPSCTPGSSAPAGLAGSRVLGLPTADEFWGHENFDSAACSDLNNGLQELARGGTLGGTGWEFGVTYRFRFEFGATSVRVYVDDNLELDLAGQFSNGRFAFYNFSQADVTYSGFTVATLTSTSTSTTSTTSTSSTTSSTTSTLPLGLIPGGGPTKSDCYAELGVVGIENPSPRVEKNKVVLCTDGEACDTGPCGDKECDVRIRLCINQQDANLPDCTAPSGLDRVKVKTQGKVKLNVTVPSLLEGAQCGAFLDGTIPVKVKKSKLLPGKAKIKIDAKAPRGTKPRPDSDVITIQCLPRTVECPASSDAIKQRNSIAAKFLAAPLPQAQARSH